MTFSVQLGRLDAWQLGIIVGAARSACVALDLDPAAILVLRERGIETRSCPPISLGASGRADVEPAASRLRHDLARGLRRMPKRAV